MPEGTVARGDDRLAALRAARARMVEQRHELAGALSEPFQRPRTIEMRDEFVRVQACIDAIDRAIKDEERQQPGVGMASLP